MIAKIALIPVINMKINWFPNIMNLFGALIPLFALIKYHAEFNITLIIVLIGVIIGNIFLFTNGLIKEY